jgi:hypothetical protein
VARSKRISPYSRFCNSLVRYESLVTDHPPDLFSDVTHPNAHAFRFKSKSMCVGGGRCCYVTEALHTADVMVHHPDTF